ncbi:ABC transporter permease [Coriobacteriia bacterium Es71-Z0120]|uniref:ABC transporter permease n=1 Tax=Parvivirga hydrogeniphila TaxID=2939460 RepID=UPI002260A7E9|nr:ABC transporter permease [Parvivirga hydrogeniphila]MCL4078248.1 ABC transporter permease [Parvivirga hydrogeniphila]
MKRPASRIAGYAAATAFALVVWQAVAAALGTRALPSPAETARVLAERFTPDILPNLGISVWRVVFATAIGLALGAPAGLAMGRSKRLDAVAGPLVFLGYPVPKVVFLPILLVLFGIGDAPKVALIALIVFFQILVTARDAARGVQPSAILSVRSLGATRWQVFRHVVVPAALPDIFTALRISTGTAIAVLFFSETVAGTDGLGWYIMDAWTRIAYPEMFAGIVVMALMGVTIYELLEALESRICRWTRAGVER